ncbi:DUF4328 domain-containing protein [Streptomyces sparsogenes]|uniref:DUF4328 domain-containing protein n=1 Tax=Streptomyces sparsogenes DSM 40356 TaxID=1331668 RepID=A0A1R1S5J5_9ACTN|nr:DUF4328 domain-containing protein [Streptomyces sparsogenes]OMI33472.1 hypothetical protein SPAR_41434 [Streptomyces sparsogenes DSM 40356]
MPAAPPLAYPSAPPLGMPAGGVDLRRGLSTALVVLFSVMLPALVFVLVARGDQYGVIGDILDGGLLTTGEHFRELEDADDVYTTAVLISFFILVALAVLWAVWFRRLRLNAEVFAPGQHRFGSGWAAGSWFTPVVNLWFPKQIANDIWRASSPQGPHNVRRGLLNGWWVTWIVAGAANFIGTIRYNTLRSKMESADYNPTYAKVKSDIEELHDILALDMFATVVLIAAAILALLLVRQITAMQEQRASLPPQPGGAAPYGAPAAPYGTPAAPYGTPAAPYGTPPPYGPPGPTGPADQPYPPYGHG